MGEKPQWRDILRKFFEELDLKELTRKATEADREMMEDFFREIKHMEDHMGEREGQSTQPSLRAGTEFTPRSLATAKAEAIAQQEQEARPHRARIQYDEIRYMKLVADNARDVNDFLTAI